jgi:hypothetical protein
MDSYIAGPPNYMTVGLMSVIKTYEGSCISDTGDTGPYVSLSTGSLFIFIIISILKGLEREVPRPFSSPGPIFHYLLRRSLNSAKVRQLL